MTSKILTSILAISFSLLLTLCVAGQPGGKSPGIKLFDSGDFAGAVEALKKSDDFVDLNYLGYAYEKLGKEKEARNAFDESFKNGYKVFEGEIIKRSHFDKDESVPDDKLSEFLTKSFERLLVVALSARRTVELKGSTTNDNEWLIRAQMFSEIGRLLSSGQMLYSIRELDAPLTVTAKPRPGFTDKARSAGTQGSVTVLILFDVDGKVKAAIPVIPLPNGLTEQTIMAASKIEFTPAERKGQAVPILQAMSYKFTIY